MQCMAASTSSLVKVTNPNTLDTSVRNKKTRMHGVLIIENRSTCACIPIRLWVTLLPASWTQFLPSHDNFKHGFNQSLGCRPHSEPKDSGIISNYSSYGRPTSSALIRGFERIQDDVVDGSSAKSPNSLDDSSIQALCKGFAGSLHGGDQSSN